ncbi:TlpA family protein disulfide reductase [Paenibacillus allorhizosphaerae]|uniref:Thiol-disulfide oxidoreductase ResA n=1 Tax=Paenibacillus allorhizosphaerae TaxID=2849866 RepID=A0ABN7TQ58_9BACL|nr:TlpA disulfide reductase family protein [Paenibacillus allorhizosphaerae]CAG7650848.1 Thiol-disulfide oxidoreductase ResA [Paenibacillus allorhizosphaerae]
MKKIALLTALAVVLVVLGVYQSNAGDGTAAIAQASASRPELKHGLAVPSFSLKAMDGADYHVGGPRDKPLIVNFWASWCGPCHEEAPDLAQLYERYKGEIDLYAVNVTKGDSLKDARSFVKQYGYRFPVLLDSQGEAAAAYRILFVPTSFLIDKHGNLREIIHVLPREELEKRIQSLIEA